MEITQQQDQDLNRLLLFQILKHFLHPKCSCLFVLERPFFSYSRKGGNVSRSMEKRFSNDLTLPFEPFRWSPKRKGALFFLSPRFLQESPLPTSFGEICILSWRASSPTLSMWPCKKNLKYFSHSYFSYYNFFPNPTHKTKIGIASRWETPE